MRVMIDARVSMGGIERYVRGLLPILERSLPPGGLTVYGRHWPSDPNAADTMAERRSRGTLRSSLGHLKRIAVDQFALPRAVAKSGADIVHSPGGLVPRGIRVPVVATIHDLWQIDRFDTKKPGPMKYYERAVALSAIRRAACIVVPTAAVARRVTERFGIADERVRVVHPPVADLPAPGPLPGAHVRRLAGGFFLTVGAVEPRKNLERLAQAHRIVYRRCGLPLVVAGGYGWSQKDFVRAAADSAGRILWLGFVDDATLAGLYSRATALVQFSLDEGFSYPVAEAMTFGAPMILSDIETHREVARDLAAYASPTDVEACAERMMAAAGWSDEMRASHAGRARSRLEEIRRNGDASLYLSVYRECLD